MIAVSQNHFQLAELITGVTLGDAATSVNQVESRLGGVKLRDLLHTSEEMSVKCFQFNPAPGSGSLSRRESPVPDHIANRFRQIPNLGLDLIRDSLKRHYFIVPRAPIGYLETEAGRRDLENHLARRLTRHRQTIIPWLDGVRTLAGSKVLEIGCGTGCSTVALAEQGAMVVAVDLDGPSVEVAKLRCAVYGLNVAFSLANAVEVGELFHADKFDLIIFYASLEHMSYDERISAIRATWGILAPGDLWCVVETPNRLWYTDDHTSLLPFFHWLPDELAFDYARYSERPNFSERYQDFNDKVQRHDFLRRGRGVSFHEFAIAIGPPEKLNVCSSLSTFIAGRKRRPRSWLRSWMKGPPPISERYRSLLAEICPPIHPAFLEKDLDLILMK
jgi:S-adenosylmethionine-dependent methyltransferase